MPTPFHTLRSDHTGALRKPDWLLDQYVERYEGRIDNAELERPQERAVSEVIRRQEERVPSRHGWRVPAGTFDSLRFMPAHKVAVLGLVSNHGEVESSAYVEKRLAEASRILPLEQLALCPRCGMGSAPDEDRQWAKLRVIQEVAREVWA